MSDIVFELNGVSFVWDRRKSAANRDFMMA